MCRLFYLVRMFFLEQLGLARQRYIHACAHAAVVRSLTCQAKYDRQPIITQDGGTVALDWFQPRGLDKIPSDAPIVLVLHGLTGSYHTFEPTTLLAVEEYNAAPFASHLPADAGLCIRSRTPSV